MRTRKEWLEHGIALYRQGGRDREAVACFRRIVLYENVRREWDAVAAAWLGRMHAEGCGVRRDLHTALLWYRKAVQWSPQFDIAREILSELEQLAPEPFPSPETIDEPGLGRVIVKRTRTYCRIGRFRENAVEVHILPELPYDYAVVLAWSHFRNRLEESYLPPILDESFRRSYPLFRLGVERGTEHRYGYRQEGKCYTIVTPCDVRFDELITREAIVERGWELMLTAAEEFLPRRLEEISRKIGIPYASCRIKRLKRALGLYYPDEKRVVLSCHLMKYPLLKVDAVIVHELCHAIHCNHSQQFKEAVRHYGGDRIAEADLNWGRTPPSGL